MTLVTERAVSSGRALRPVGGGLRGVSSDPWRSDQSFCGALGVALDLVVTRHAFVALQAPVGVIDRMLAHPFRQRCLRADRTLHHRHFGRHVAVGHDFLDATA